MFKHNLKIAFRNLRKYKTQNIISIVGLAVGFVCFAFSALWIRYEMSFDSFHAKADRIYRVDIAPFKWDTHGGSVSEVQTGTPNPLSEWLKSNIPEIEEACVVNFRVYDENHTILYFSDQNFCNIFDIDLPESLFVANQTSRPVAVTRELYNEETVKIIKEKYNYDVMATLPIWPANTNLQFNMAAPLFVRGFSSANLNSWQFSQFQTYILVKEGIDVKALKSKLDKIEISQLGNIPVSLILTPITRLRYEDPTGQIKADVRIGHIRIFTVAGLLVILCSLFNHLTLFVTRVQMRLRELALRKVNGAADVHIAATLFIDFLLVILFSIVSGFVLIICSLPFFKEYASIGIHNSNIYIELALYAALLIFCSFLASSISVFYFRKQGLNESIKGGGNPASQNIFRKSTLFVQLTIGLGMMFCAVVFFKQLNFLHQTGLNINRHNIAALEPAWLPSPPPGVTMPLHYVDQIKQVPGVIDAIPLVGGSFMRNMINRRMPITRNIEKEGQNINYTFFTMNAHSRFFDFFGIEIIEGAKYADENSTYIVVNETMMNDLGKEVMTTQFEVAGIARDFYLSPTSNPMPISFRYPFTEGLFLAIGYKYEEGLRVQTEEAVTKWFRSEFPERGSLDIGFTYMEDIFEEHIKSERALLKLLSVMTLACILIAIFGVYSLTSLTRQQRRKEIAVRKVHGAEVLDILNIFFKEYLILLALAALVAFPTGYLIMKRWLEGYVKQTSMDAWLYVAIFLVVFVVIVVSIFSTVWRAANRNPAEVVKSE